MHKNAPLILKQSMAAKYRGMHENGSMTWIE